MNDLQSWIGQLFENPELLGMGHDQSKEDGNLGLGWLYYGLARILRPQTAVVIGSWRGFVPMTIARGIADNGAGGRVIFIDPSLVDDHWKVPEAVSQYFLGYGIENITHHCVTTQEFVDTEAYRQLLAVDLLFVDGYHTSSQAQFDHETFMPLLTDDAIVLFHDTAGSRQSKMYGVDKAYLCDVYRYTDALKRRRDLDVFDLPISSGVTLVRKRMNAR